MEIIYLVTTRDEGLRAVDVLTSRTGMSRLLTKKIRLYGELLNNGQPFRMIDPVKAGDQLVARTADEKELRLPLREIPELPFIFQDDWLAIINKPAGIVVHPTFKHETGTMTDLLADYPLHPVSRLDRDTSGLVMIARNGHAHHVVTGTPMQKIYWGLVHGQMPAASGLIDAPIRRDPDSLIKRQVASDGALAQTRYHVIRVFPQANLSAVRFELLTGRTHQIRVHTSSIGCPLVGDTLYGHRDDEMDEYDRFLNRQALHALSLAFTHPLSRQVMRFQAPLPADLRDLLKLLRGREF